MEKTNPNVANRTMFIRDNLDVLSGVNDSCIDLIYLDPPFNSNRNYAAPAGSKAAGASFRDAWTLDMIDEAWIEVIQAERPKLAALIEGIGEVNGNGDKSYLIFMARRLLEMHRVLKESGSIYLHCDPTMSHSLKLLMDSIFTKNNFRNEIMWRKTNSPKAQSSAFGEQHDIILYYTKSESFVFNKTHTKPDEKYLKSFSHEDERGRYQTIPLVAAGLQKSDGRKQFDFQGVKAPWLYGKKTLDEWWAAGLIVKTKEAYRKKSYLSDSKGKIVSDIWADDDVLPLQGRAKESTGYPTQKPLSLLERIIKASSNENDLILDPFCGCATACVAAERLGRNWIGIDLSDKSVDLIRERLEAEEHLWRQVGKGKHIIPRDDLPERTDVDSLITDMRGHKDVLYGECGGDCQGCKKHFEKRNLEIDHKTPRSKGGSDTKGNLQLLCGSCNRIKGNRSHEYLHARLKELKHI